MKLAINSGSLKVDFEENEYNGQSYEIGGERLSNGNFWVHKGRIRKIFPSVQKPTIEEVQFIIEALEKYCADKSFKIEF